MMCVFGSLSAATTVNKSCLKMGTNWQALDMCLTCKSFVFGKFFPARMACFKSKQIVNGLDAGIRKDLSDCQYF